MKNTLLKAMFTASFLFFFYAVFSKILHVEGADTLLLIGLITSAPCFIYVVYEVLSSQSMKREGKLLWLLGAFMVGWPVMLFYIFIGRKGDTTTNKLRTT
jgi:hypothetical protein